MATKDCKSCVTLKDKAPEFILNGVTDNVCTSLKNNTGFSTSNGNDNCTDLDLANDCLIGNMEPEVGAYEVCDWKGFMPNFIHNVWEFNKALNCSMCGLWTKVTEALSIANNALKTANTALTTANGFKDDIKKIFCYIDFLLNGTDVSGKLDVSNFTPGTGVDFNRSDERAVMPGLRINGSTYTIMGSIRVNLSNTHWNRLGLTNTGSRVQWGTESSEYNRINTPAGNYTICVIKIPKKDFPWIRSFSSSVGSFVDAGVGQVFVNAYDGDSDDNQMRGQWGVNESSDITVPKGQIWVRVSLVSLTTWGIEYNSADGYAQCTFRATGLVRTIADSIEC